MNFRNVLPCLALAVVGCTSSVRPDTTQPSGSMVGVEQKYGGWCLVLRCGDLAPEIRTDDNQSIYSYCGGQMVGTVLNPTGSEMFYGNIARNTFTPTSWHEEPFKVKGGQGMQCWSGEIRFQTAQ